MLKKDELATPTSCLNKAEPDEPIFVLKATDPQAPMVVRHWVTMSSGKQDKKKLDGALELAKKMEAWRKQNCVEEAAEYPHDGRRLR